MHNGDIKLNSHVQMLANKLSKFSFMIKSFKLIWRFDKIQNVYFNKFQALLQSGKLFFGGGNRDWIKQKDI